MVESLEERNCEVFGYANYFIEKRTQGVGTEFLCENRVFRLSSHSMFNCLPA